MKFIKKSIVLLIFSILSGYSSIYPMEEEEEKTSVEIAYQLEQAFVQDQNQFEALIASLSPDNFIEHLAAIAEIIPLLENSDLITHICSTIVTAITQQEQNSELYNQAVKNMVPVVDFLIRKKELPGLSQIIVLYNIDEQWAEVCNRIKMCINELLAENASRGYALKRKSDTSFYKKPETKKQKAEADAPPAVIPSLVALCASHVVNNIRSNRYEDNTFVNSFDFAQEAKLSEIEDSCLALLYKKSQKKNKKGFGKVIKWLNELNLSGTQRKAFKNYIVNNSRSIQSLLVKAQLQTTCNELKLPFDVTTIFGMVPSCSGNLIAAQIPVKGGLTFFNWKTNTSVLAKKETPHIFKMKFTSDGKKLISFTSLTGEATICEWDCQTGECIKERTISLLDGNGRYFNLIVLNADKKQVIVGFPNGNIKLYDIENDTYESLPITINGSILLPKFSSNLLEFSSNGKKLVISTYLGTKIYDVETWDEIARFIMPINECILSEHFIVFKTSNNANKVYNFERKECNDLFAAVDRYSSRLLAISPDETIIATNNRHSICLWDCQTGQLLKTIQGPNESIYEGAFCDDGQSFMCISGTNSVYRYNFIINKKLMADLDLEAVLWIEYMIPADLYVRLTEIYYNNTNLYAQLPDELKRQLNVLIR